MKLDDFLEEVLPTEGNYFVEWNTWPGENHIQKKVRDLAAASLLIRQKSQKAQDTWIAIGSFKNSRKAMDCLRKKALYTDIDAGPGKDYANAQDAEEALWKAVDDNFIPHPTIVLESGNGIHTYWVLEEDISVGDWRLLTNRLKIACRKAELKVDPKVTTDPARIMRPPETLNFKDRSNPKSVRVRRENWFPETKYTWAGLSMVLPSDDTEPALQQVAPSPSADALAAAVSVEDLTNGVDLGPLMTKPEPERIALAKQMLDHLRGPKYQTYDNWMRIGAALSDLHKSGANSNSSDWRDLWDGWSQENDQGKYDQAELDKKWQEEFPRFRRITAGTLIFMAKENGFIFPNAVHKVSYPQGYVATEFGTIREPREDEDNPTLVMAAHLHDVNVRADPTRGFVYSARVVHPSANRTMDLETSSTSFNGGGQALGQELGCAGITVSGTKQQREIIVFLESFREQLRDARGVSDVVNTFGWCTRNKRNGFAAGRYIYWDDGTRTEGVSAPAEIRDLYTPQGSLGTWRSIVQPLLDQNRQSINCAIASAFAAPLITFTGIAGMVLSLFSRDSGTGKSTALKAAQSVWGRPQGGINALDDTVNAMTKRLEVLQNLPAYWDEVRMYDVAQAFVKLVFQLSQGKGKARLNAAAKMQHTGTWNTMIVVAGNESLQEHLSNLVNSTNAGALRLLELEVDAVGDGATQSLTQNMDTLGRLETTYGTAGSVYAQWLANNKAVAQQAVPKAMRVFEASLNPKPDERFWLATISALYVGAYFADKRLGLLDFNLPSLREYLCQEFLKHRKVAGRKSSANSSLMLLSEFLEQRHGFSIVTNKVALGRGNPGTIEIDWPLVPTAARFPLAYQKGKDNIVLISIQELKSWLNKERSMNHGNLVSTLVKMGGSVQRVTLAAGTPIASTRNRVETLILDCNEEPLSFLV